MKTKIGEIKTIRDFFARSSGEPKWENSYLCEDKECDHMNGKCGASGKQVNSEDLECKLCGEKINMLTEFSAQSSADPRSLYNPDNRLSQHLEIHERVKKINI